MPCNQQGSRATNRVAARPFHRFCPWSSDKRHSDDTNLNSTYSKLRHRPCRHVPLAPLQIVLLTWNFTSDFTSHRQVSPPPGGHSVHSCSPPHLNPGAVPIGLRKAALVGRILSVLPPKTSPLCCCRASAISLELSVTNAKVPPLRLTSQRTTGAAAVAGVGGHRTRTWPCKNLTRSGARVP